MDAQEKALRKKIAEHLFQANAVWSAAQDFSEDMPVAVASLRTQLRQATEACDTLIAYKRAQRIAQQGYLSIQEQYDER